MDTVAFRIDADPLGGKVELAGEDITDRVAAVELRVAPGQPTVLTVHSLAEGAITGAGIVQVVDPAQADAEVICAFLAAIDPEQLDSDALGNADASQNLTAVMLEQLQRYARGEHAAD